MWQAQRSHIREESALLKGRVEETIHVVQSGRKKAIGYLVGKSKKTKKNKTNQTAIKLSERRPIPLCVSHSSCISFVPVKPIAMLKSMDKHKSSDADNHQHPILAGKAQCAMKGDLCVKEAGKMKWSHPCRYAKMKEETKDMQLCYAESGRKKKSPRGKPGWHTASIRGKSLASILAESL